MLGRGITPGTRREPIHGGSGATSMSLTVPGVTPRPITGYTRLEQTMQMQEFAYQDGTLKAKGVWYLPSGPYETRSRVRGPMEKVRPGTGREASLGCGFMPCPEGRYHTALATTEYRTQNLKRRNSLKLKPIGQRNPDTDSVHTLIVVNQAFTVATKILDITFYIRITPDGKTPPQFNCTTFKP